MVLGTNGGQSWHMLWPEDMAGLVRMLQALDAGDEEVLVPQYLFKSSRERRPWKHTLGSLPGTESLGSDSKSLGTELTFGLLPQ